ncbi:MAG: hypothetical protein JNK85_06260 [Verrucomicrobiales bacterium]|nr:hypothetical protein [Verrucomicrobiales bacterium]
MKSTVAMLVVMAFVFPGCGKEDAAPAQATNQASGNPLTAPVDYLGAVGSAQKQAERVVDLANIQRAVQAFQAGEERLPTSLQELVTEGYFPRLPSAPKGMAYAYHPQSGRVTLVPATAGAGAAR